MSRPLYFLLIAAPLAVIADLLQLLALYFILAVVFFFLPVAGSVAH